MKHDAGWAKDYGEDIDAILVFVSDTYLLYVQPAYHDDDVRPVCSLRSSPPSSLRPTPSCSLVHPIRPASSPSMSIVPPSINMTISNLLSPSLSSPSAAVRWINSLFFVSLVLSLASAFFGILAKQWMREYMQWNSPLGAPRENVLVRQARIEAWEAWRVVAFISSIPALLELAMVFFLVGVAILLWTLDSIVAITVTITVGLFLVAAITLTILPVFYVRCPYKSPTAWACISAWNLLPSPPKWRRNPRPSRRASALRLRILRSPFRNIVVLPRQAFERLCHILAALLTTCIHILGRWRTLFADVSTAAAERPSATWRERDLAAMRDVEVSESVRDAAEDALWKQVRPDPQMALPFSPVSPLQQGFSGTLANALMIDISETALLMDALVWVSTASQDTRVKTYIDECLNTIRLTFSDAEISSSDLSCVRNAGLLCALSSYLNHGNLRRPHAALTHLHPRFTATPALFRKDLDWSDAGFVPGPTTNQRRFVTLLRVWSGVRLPGRLTPTLPETTYTALFVRIVAAHVSQSVSALSALTRRLGASATTGTAARGVFAEPWVLVRLISESTVAMNLMMASAAEHLSSVQEEQRWWLKAIGSILRSDELRNTDGSEGTRLHPLVYAMVLGAKRFKDFKFPNWGAVPCTCIAANADGGTIGTSWCNISAVCPF